jgi:hypothetical protein
VIAKHRTHTIIMHVLTVAMADAPPPLRAVPYPSHRCLDVNDAASGDAVVCT